MRVFAFALLLTALCAPAHAGSIGYAGRGYGEGYFYDEESNKIRLYAGIVYVDAGVTYSDDGSESYGEIRVFSSDHRIGTVLAGEGSVSWGGGWVAIGIAFQDLSASIILDRSGLDPAVGGIVSPSSGGSFAVSGWSGDIAGTLGAAPEPTSFLMLAIGVAGLAVGFRRRR